MGSLRTISKAMQVPGRFMVHEEERQACNYFNSWIVQKDPTFFARKVTHLMDPIGDPIGESIYKKRNGKK